MTQHEISAAITTAKEYLWEWTKFIERIPELQAKLQRTQNQLDLFWNGDKSDSLPNDFYDRMRQEQSFYEGLEPEVIRQCDIKAKLERALPIVCWFARQANINPDPLKRLWDLRHVEWYPEAWLVLSHASDEFQVTFVSKTSEADKPRGKRGRPPGSASMERDRKLYQEWKTANSISGITKADFLRKQGLTESDLAAIERGRAQLKRNPSGQN
jgi:hypothetical protein